MDDIYRRENGYEKELQLLEKAQISQINKEIILKYHRHILSEGSGKNRVVKLSGELRKIAQWLNKPFLEVTEEDIRDLITQISQSDYAELTKVDFKKLVRRFYKWLEGNNKSYPDKVDWIKCKEKIGNKESLDIITPSEIKRVIDTCESPRDKAFISLLYEGGFRIGEMLNMKIRDLKNERNYMKVSVTGKTGPREVLIIYSIPYLNQYLNLHPLKNNLDAPFWISIRGYKHNQKLIYLGVRKLIKRVFKRAGVNKKRLYPHLFRHSRATELAKHFTESQMKAYFGWTPGSNMAAIYVHMSGRDVDGSVLRYYGIEDKKEDYRDKLNNNIICPRCQLVNSFTEKVCVQCGLNLKLPLETESNQELDKNLKFLINLSKNPKMMEEFEKFKEQFNQMSLSKV